MTSKNSIDFPPREFSSVEIKSLFMLSAEVQENLDNIGATLAALANASYLDRTADEMLRYMDGEAQRARVKIDKLVSIISVEKGLITGED